MSAPRLSCSGQNSSVPCEASRRCTEPRGRGEPLPGCRLDVVERCAVSRAAAKPISRPTRRAASRSSLPSSPRHPARRSRRHEADVAGPRARGTAVGVTPGCQRSAGRAPRRPGITSRPPTARLVGRRVRHGRSATRDDDRVVRRSCRSSGRAVGVVHHVVVAGGRPRGRDARQTRVALDRVDVLRDARQDGGGVSRASADLEHAVSADGCRGGRHPAATMWGCEIVCPPRSAAASRGKQTPASSAGRRPRAAPRASRRGTPASRTPRRLDLRGDHLLPAAPPFAHA